MSFDLQKTKSLSYKDFLILDIQDALAELDSGKSGLNQTEAKKRLETFGFNELEKEEKVSALKTFWDQIKSPLMMVLVLAAIVSGILGDRTDMILILVMIFFSSILGFYQEFRSQKAVRALAKKVSLVATVLRNGKEMEIPANQVVLGDILKITAGDVLAADVRLLEAKNLSFNESLLTGEAFSAEKNIEPLPSNELVPQEAKNCAFMGTSVMSGIGSGLVVATGKQTQVGKTSHYLKIENLETEFQRGTRKFGKFLVLVIAVLVGFVFAANTFSHHGLLESLLFSLALAIGITPELLPAIITINLSQGAIAMAKKNVIVKRLIAIENLGNINILCTDKTGTLTEGAIRFQEYFDVEGKHDDKVLLYTLLASPFISKDKRVNPLEAAIWEFAKEDKFSQPEFKNYQELDYLSFDFERKRNTVLFKNGDNFLVVAKGAVEPILKICSKIELNGKIEPIGKYEQEVLKKVQNWGNRGFRLMAVAYKNVEPKKEISLADEKEMIFSGFLVFGDFIKPTAKKTLAQLEKLGIELKILTGDNIYVSQHVAGQVGIQVKKTLSGDEIAALSDEQLKNIAGQINIFYRITPEHKLRIIKALRSAGETVGFMGDGVNDAPALKAADVGISVDSAVDIAREAAEIILMRQDLDILVQGVGEGRKTFGNTMKYIFNATSSNFGNMLSVAGASLFLPFLPMLPSQIIFLNFLGDVSAITIASDNVDADYLKKPKHWDIKSIGRFMVPFGLLSSVFDFSTFFLLLYLLKASLPVFRTGWFVESLITEVLVIFIIRTKKLFFRSKPSPTLVLANLASILIGLAVVLTPLAGLFGFEKPPAWFFLLILSLVAAYLVLAEIMKKIYYQYLSKD